MSAEEVPAPRLTMRREFERVDGVAILATEPYTNSNGARSATIERVLLEDGRELVGCLKCDVVSDNTKSLYAHLRKHAYEEGRTVRGKGKRRRETASGAVVLMRRPRPIETIAAEITAVSSHLDDLKAEMAAALGLDSSWSARPRGER